MEDKQAEEIQVEENGEKTKEEADKQGDKGDADNEVDDTRNPTRLQEDETDIGDLNPAGPNQAKWGYSDQEILELESDKIFDFIKLFNIFFLVLGANFCNVGLKTFREVHMKSRI